MKRRHGAPPPARRAKPGYRGPNFRGTNPWAMTDTEARRFNEQCAGDVCICGHTRGEHAGPKRVCPVRGCICQNYARRKEWNE